MNRRLLIILVIAAAVAVGAYLLISGRWRIEGNPGAAAEEGGPVASVEVAPATIGTVTEEVEAYGTVVPAPGAVQVLSVPFESRARRIMVSGGQKISSGEVLLSIEPSPDTYLKLEEARNAFRLAREGLKQMRRRIALKLATNDQLLKSRQSFEEARLRIESMKKQGIDGLRAVRADTAGLVSKVNVQEGSIVPAGAPLVEIVARNRLEALIGIEPEDIKSIRAGGAVSLSHVNVETRLEAAGRIRKISSAVNPATRLVDVFVSLPSSQDFLLGEYIRGKMAIARAEGLMVPMAAVLPEGGRYVLFTVKKNRAVKRYVEPSLSNRKNVVVTGGGIRPGDRVVVLGNYELKDGMAVKVTTAR